MYVYVCDLYIVVVVWSCYIMSTACVLQVVWSQEKIPLWVRP